MNKKTSISCFILIIIPFFLGCRGPVNEENENNASAGSVSLGQKYDIDAYKSIVAWKGSMSVGSNFHQGYVSISEGELMIEKGQIVGGTVEVNMNTIEDENHQSDNNLIKHLKDPDFFDVEKFPVAAFSFTKASSKNSANNRITGNLTIKGITHAVDFPAKIELKDGIVKVNGKLSIDRTKWGIRYKSGRFYDLLADQTLSDSIEFYISILAKE